MGNVVRREGALPSEQTCDWPGRRRQGNARGADRWVRGEAGGTAWDHLPEVASGGRGELRPAGWAWPFYYLPTCPTSEPSPGPLLHSGAPFPSFGKTCPPSLCGRRTPGVRPSPACRTGPPPPSGRVSLQTLCRAGTQLPVHRSIQLVIPFCFASAFHTHGPYRVSHAQLSAVSEHGVSGSTSAPASSHGAGQPLGVPHLGQRVPEMVGTDSLAPVLTLDHGPTASLATPSLRRGGTCRGSA